MATRSSLFLMIPLLGACSTHRPNVTVSEPPPLVESAAPEMTWFYLNGEQIIRADVLMIDRSLVASVSHFVGAAARERHGEHARDVVEIATKKEVADRVLAQNSSPTPLYLLDGRQVPDILVAVLDPSKINSVEVLKGTAALAYGETARDGVILIASKAR